MAKAYYIERRTQIEIAREVGHGKSYVSKKLDKAEKDMQEAASHYLDWKYNTPGGKNCYWAGDWEKKYMWYQDYLHGDVSLHNTVDTSWMEKIRRLGL